MKRKIESGIVMLCALLLSSGAARASYKDCFNCLGFTEGVPTVPEVDFHGLGSVGVGTLLMVLGYTARKGYRKIADRNR